MQPLNHSTIFDSTDVSETAFLFLVSFRFSTDRLAFQQLQLTTSPPMLRGLSNQLLDLKSIATFSKFTGSILRNVDSKPIRG